MDIRNFQYLVEVYRCRSISRAAQNLFISQPHLSRVIRSIEDEFGVTIFVREGGKLTVTSEGEHFLQQVSELLEQYEKLQAPQRPESLLKIATMKHTAVYRGLAAYQKVNFRDFYALYIFVEEVNGFLLGFSKVPEHTKGNTQVLSLNIREDFERYTSEYGVIYQADLDQQEQARINQVIQALKDV